MRDLKKKRPIFFILLWERKTEEWSAGEVSWVPMATANEKLVPAQRVSERNSAKKSPKKQSPMLPPGPVWWPFVLIDHWKDCAVCVCVCVCSSRSIQPSITFVFAFAGRISDWGIAHRTSGEWLISWLVKKTIRTQKKWRKNRWRNPVN